MKLWQKEYTVDPTIEKFTVGNDYILDHVLVPFDCQASIAHANMLAHVGLLTQKEVQQLTKTLQEIVVLWEQGKFVIQSSDEDCHTAIENYLTKKLESLGQKIHTGRSRNDQVLTALRLYEKDALATVQKLLTQLKQVIDDAASKWKNIQMPGYTHTRKAMPTTIGMLFGAYSCAIDDSLALLASIAKMIDMCPLGSGAGFGISTLPLDPVFTAKFLKFSKSFDNPIHIHSTRGKYEASIVHCVSQIMFDLNKCATDIIMFSTGEFGFLDIAQQICTGSSIMPQKKNPDVFELVRGYYHVACGHEIAIKGIIGNLISGYHRDFQLIKQPLMQSLDITIQSLKAMIVALSHVSINEAKCNESMTSELYATDEAYKLVKEGVPFRQAYKKVSKEYDVNAKDNDEKKNNTLFIFVAMIASILMFASCSTNKKNTDELIIGTCAGFPPYEILNAQGDVVGFDIDVAQKIATNLGKKLVIKDMSFDALTISLKQGKIDMIVAGVSITKARLNEFSMVHYHGKPLKSLPVLFWKQIPENVTTIADLAQQPNKIVCAQIGTIQEEIISKYSYLEIKHLENISDLIMDIKHGKSIAAVVEPLVVNELKQQIPEIVVMELPLKEDEQDMGHGIGINKNNKELLTVVEKIINQCKADGTLTALEAKWFIWGNHDNK